METSGSGRLFSTTAATQPLYNRSFILKQLRSAAMPNGWRNANSLADARQHLAATTRRKRWHRDQSQHFGRTAENRLKDWVEAGGLLPEPYEQPVLLSSMGCSADRRPGMARHVDCRSGRTRS